MSSAARLLPRRRASRRATALLSTVSVLSTGLFLWGIAGAHHAAASSPAASVTKTETIARTHLINGQNVVADKRTVTMTASGLTNLHDREAVDLTWQGAHPTGGIYYDANSEDAGYAEYPMVILQCRGIDSTHVPAKQQLSPKTCFTQTPNTRYQPPFSKYGFFPPYRLDRYETKVNRKQIVNAPTPRPAACPDATFGAERWVPFIAADGTKYPGGYNGCGGLAPEQSVTENALIPPNSVFGTTALDGTGQANFVVQDATDNASLGCSTTVACAIVAIPIMGISCDAGAKSLPVVDRPTNVPAAEAACASTGFYSPGQPTGNQKSADPNSDTAVNGLLWWSESNWRNRITFPISMATTSAVCNVLGGGAPTNIYGSPYMLQATQQWAPTFCQDPKLFRLQHTQTPEIEAKNLLANSVINGHYAGVKAVFQGAPPSPAFKNPVAQAPTALSGWGIGYIIDDAKQQSFTGLKLDARLLAKLMTMSYPVVGQIQSDWANTAKYKALANNPLDMSRDPEFLALNPGASTPFINQFEASATLFMMSSDTDVMSALTSYINADPEARAWLNGKPDPWGMVVNPNYRGIKLPLTSWPQLDTFYDPLNNACIQDNHSPYLPLVAAPVADPSQITFNLQLGIANSQVNCTVYGSDTPGQRRLTAVGREQPGLRFIVGLVSVADARRYKINLAALQTHNSNPGSTAQFTTSAGRTFVSPNDQTMLNAGRMMQPDDTVGSWNLPYKKLDTTSAGQNAYPGTMLMSTDIPTAGLDSTDATNYAKFLDYVAGPGSTPGGANGQLAAGYVPLTAANGLGAMHTFTVASAIAVAQQLGFVPKPSDPVIPSSGPTTRPGHYGTGAHQHRHPGRSGPGPNYVPTPGAGAGAVAPPAGARGSVGTGLTPAGGAPSSIPSSHTSTTTQPPATPSPSPVAAEAPTPDSKPGWSAYALPALAILALASGLLAAWSSPIGRRR